MVMGSVMPVLLALLATALLGAFWLRRNNPAWYWRLVGAPVACVRMMWHWKAICIERHWTAQRRTGRVVVGGVMIQGREVRPKIPRMWVSTRHGVLTAKVRLLPGQTPDTYVQGAEALAHAWRVFKVRVWSPDRGYVWMRVSPFDALSGQIDYAEPEMDVVGGAADSSPPRDLVLPLGIRESGDIWKINLRLVPHWLIVGATLSGKSTLIRTLVARLSALPVALVGIDLKGGLELSLYGARLSALARTRAQAAHVFTQVLDMVLERAAMCAEAGVTAVWDLPDPPPPLVVIVDELAELFLSDRSERELREIVTTTLQRIAQMGASLDVHLIVAGQRVGSDLGPGVTLFRSQMTGRVCLRVADRESAEMVLSDLAPDAVALAMSITPENQGTAVAADESGGWERVKGAMTTVDQARSAATRYAFLRVPLPGLDAPGPVDETDAETEVQG
jgi:S-DNA-T family DNA segregation ATPase FtsK/SpoIIIE